MSNTLILAGKEWKEIYRSKVFMFMTLLLIVLTLVSIGVSFMVFSSQLAEYQSSLDVLRQLGKLDSVKAPELHPLNLMRGVVGYIEIIGAVLGVILGYITVAKERNTKAGKLLLSRPVSITQVLHGKILGNSIFILLLLTAISACMLVAVYTTTGAAPSTIQIDKTALFVIFSTVYIMIFFIMSLFFSLQQKNTANALMISFVIWLVFVLLMPQIGDTMDPDNQVPGGFFKSMQIDRAQEKEVMKDFSGYETVRGGIEQLSVTKHFERASFALFGVKQMYNGMVLSEILNETRGNVVWLIGGLLLMYAGCVILLLKNKNYLGG